MKQIPEIIARLGKVGGILAAVYQEQSFTRAADRLGLDQSAVSHRIKELETLLGYQLFIRTTRSLRITEEGRLLCEAAISSTTIWADALKIIDQQVSSNQLRLSLPSSLAMNWLIPALPRAEDFDLKIAIDVNDEVLDLHAAVDTVAIRFGSGPYPGEFAARLTGCQLIPVVSPGYRGADANMLTEAGKAALTLLADRRAETDGTDFTWSAYLKGLRLPEDHGMETQYFDRADLMLQAASSGMGVALGRSLLIENAVADGFLQVAGPPVDSRSHYWLVTTANLSGTKRFNTLLEWLRSEVSRTQALRY